MLKIEFVRMISVKRGKDRMATPFLYLRKMETLESS